MIYASYPFEGGGGGGGVPIYPTFASFPAGTTAGDLAVAADTGNLYEWSGSAWQQIAGPGAALALGAFGSTPNANGLSLTGGVLNMQPADATHPGGVSILAQTLAGAKTFSTAPILSSLSASLPLQLDASKNIISSAIDLSGSQATGILAAGRFPALTGDLTTVAGALATTLATVNSNVGSFTNASVTVNAKGLVTAASNGTTGNLTDVGTDGIVVTGGTGAVLGSGTSIAQHVADTTHNGYLSSTDWNTFNGKQAALTIGNLTDVGTDGIVVTGGTGAIIGSGASISQHVADSTHNGYLSSADWSTFNGKQASGNYITALTGDVTASGPGSVASTLATVNSNIGTFASTTVNAKGLVTAAAALSGDATTSGAALTLATVNSNVGSFTNANITVNAKGLVTAAANGTAGAGTAPSVQKFTSTGTATGYLFTVTSANATVGATYTNNGHTYTVLSTISAGTLLYCSQALAPAASGTLTKATGSGDATITFASSIALATYTTPTSPSPLYLRVRMVGGGGGGGGSGDTPGGSQGGTGTATYFGSGMLIGNGGTGALGSNSQSSPGTGGSASLGTVTTGFASTGNVGGSNQLATSSGGPFAEGGIGAASPFGGSGRSGAGGVAAAANSGSGGGGARGTALNGLNESGGGGGSGGYIDAIITSPTSTYVYAIGGGGSGGAAGSNGSTGGAGGSGFIIVEEMYQ